MGGDENANAVAPPRRQRRPIEAANAEAGGADDAPRRSVTTTRIRSNLACGAGDILTIAVACTSLGVVGLERVVDDAIQIRVMLIEYNLTNVNKK